jgi:membrane protein YqaA with SNARE-associated domain
MHRLNDLLQWITTTIEPIAQRLGWPGLVIVAFFDSSFVSLPEVTDLLIVWSVLREPSHWIYYGAAATAGSMAGCYALYALAKKGGEAFLRKRFHERHIERGLGLFRRYGLLAVIVPSILPPPAPFKIFVLLAGVANVRTGTFLTAIAIGRGFRYGGEAWLAYEYGPQATVFIRDNLPVVCAWAGGIIAVAGLAWIFWQRRRRTA